MIANKHDNKTPLQRLSLAQSEAADGGKRGIVTALKLKAEGVTADPTCRMCFSAIKEKRPKKPKRRPGRSEHSLQAACVTWAKLSADAPVKAKLIFAIPNGGKRGIVTALKLKAEGVTAGVPDLCLPVARGGYHALYVEMKTRTGAVSESHHKMRAALECSLSAVSRNSRRLLNFT